MGKQLYVTNAFSLNMIPETIPYGRVCFKCLTKDEALEAIAMVEGKGYPFISAVGHQSTADVFSVELGVPVKMNRTTLQLTHDVGLIVGQYVGPRLEEGVTTLPEGAKIKWMFVYLEV